MIAEWMLYAFVIALCASCLAWVSDLWIRAMGRPTRWVWAGAAMASVLIPVGMAVRPRLIAPSPENSEMTMELRATTGVTARNVQRASALGWLWLGASAVSLAVLVLGLEQLARVRRRASRHTMAGRPVAVTRNLGPGAVPFGEPKILVPRWAMALPPNAARLLVTHEEEHVRAGDTRLLLMAAFAVVAMPWNASLWWCFRRLRTAIELDCDARVLRREPAVAEYAERLLQVAQRGRLTAMPALLTLADGTTQLHVRIEAMTVRPTLTPARRAALCALAAAAAMVSCETRRPAPVAPVTDFILKDGRATALTLDPQQAESVKVRVASVPSAVAAQTDDPTRPLIIVKDALGAVVFSGRAEGRVEAVLNRVATEDIDRVEVIKRGDLLPAEAKGGVIYVTLKPGASWRGASADSAARLKYRSPGSTSIRRDTMSVAPARVTSGDTTLSFSTNSGRVALGAATGEAISGFLRMRMARCCMKVQ